MILPTKKEVQKAVAACKDVITARSYKFTKTHTYKNIEWRTSINDHYELRIQIDFFAIEIIYIGHGPHLPLGDICFFRSTSTYVTRTQHFVDELKELIEYIKLVEALGALEDVM